jgi:putative DNA primase/helicase
MTPEPLMIPLSVNVGVVNKVPKKEMWRLNNGFVSMTLDVESIASHVLDGHALSAAWVARDDEGHSKRKNDDFEQAQLIFLDIDNSVTLPDTTKRKKTESEGYVALDDVLKNTFIQEQAYLIYTSFSHTDDWHRFRIVFCLPDVITDIARYKTILEAFISRMKADEACKSPVHIFYGNTNAQVHTFGRVIEQRHVDSIVAWHANIDKEERVTEQNVNGGLTVEQVRAMLDVIPSRLLYNDWIRIISAVSSRFDEETSVQLIEAWSPGTAGEVRYKVKHRLQRIGLGTLVYIAKEHGWKPPQGFYKEAAAPQITWPMTDLGNSERLLAMLKGNALYEHKGATWYFWDTKRFRLDETGESYAKAKEAVRGIRDEAAGIRDEKYKTMMEKWAKASETKGKIESMIVLARNGTNLAVTAEELDANHAHLNLANGIFDLDDFKLYEHHIDARCTKLIDIEFDPAAECPKWMAFLNVIFDNKQDVIDFIQRAVGYSLSGLLSENCLFFAYGSGKNGKSVFFQAMEMLFQDYFQKAPTDMLMMKRGESGASNDVARLRGTRFVAAAELPEGKRFDESKVKDLTGDDTLVARPMYRDFFEFKPSHKLWVYGNHKPVITGTDDGIWRRIRLIPFTVTISEDQRRPAHEIRAEFAAEMPGILRWALNGYYLWKHDGGLQTPASVLEATASYRQEMDGLGVFIDEYLSRSEVHTVPAADVYRVYKEWAEKNGEYVMKTRAFNTRLRERGYETKLDQSTNALKWLGCSLKSSDPAIF